MTGTGETRGCIFCDAFLHIDDPESLVVFSGRTCFVILNLYPYNSGHVMIVPNRHVGTLADMTAAELDELMELGRRVEMALNEVYRPQGLNLGMNLGKPAGAGILDHLHMHVVPRWHGDTNFISVVGSVRVLPEELSQTTARLRPILRRLAEES